MKKIAFIIGNGISRKPINLSKLVDQGAIFGCNALYREFNDFHYLVSIDKQFQTIIEANDEVFGKDERIIFPPDDEPFQPLTAKNVRGQFISKFIEKRC